MTEAYNKTEIRAVDFGVGGSTVDGALIHPYAMGSSLMDFVNDFQGSYGDWTDTPGFSWRPEKSLFSFWFGVNDIAINHFKAEHGEEYVRAPLQEVFESYMRSLNTVSSLSSIQVHILITKLALRRWCTQFPHVDLPTI